MVENVIVAGAGYAGVNSFYRIKNKFNVTLISEKISMDYYTKEGVISINLKNVKKEKIIAIDVKNVKVTTEKNEYYPDKLVISTGCNRDKQKEFFKNAKNYDGKTLYSESQYDDYLLIQYILYLKASGINASYSGNTLSWLGENISNKLIDFLEKSGIKIKESGNEFLPRCEPNLFDNFLHVDDNFIVSKNVFAAGDVISSSIKCGELSMRQGDFTGRYITNNKIKFSPVFITMFNNFKSKGMRIVSNVPWKGNISRAAYGTRYIYMADFLKHYYHFMHGKMGILKYF